MTHRWRPGRWDDSISFRAIRGGDAPLPQRGAAIIVVVSLVTVEFVRAVPWPAETLPDGTDLIDRAPQEALVADACGADLDTERQADSVGRGVDFRGSSYLGFFDEQVDLDGCRFRRSAAEPQIREVK